VTKPIGKFTDEYRHNDIKGFSINRHLAKLLGWKELIGNFLTQRHL